MFSASCRDGKKRGVAILFHKALCFVPEKVHEDKELILVVGTIGNNYFTILNLYAPNEDNPTFFKEAASIIAGNAKGEIIAGGDFNCVINRKLDKSLAVGGPQSQKSKALCSIIEELGLEDIWGFKHPKEKDYTFFFSRVHNSYSSIDMFCVSKQDAHEVIDCRIEPISMLDHGLVVMMMAVDTCRGFK